MASHISAGTIIAKVNREAYKTRDITGGLPRVAELFEARRPKDPATISEIDGVVRFGEIKRGKREIFVQPTRLDGQLAVVDDTQEAAAVRGARPGSTSACTKATVCAPVTGLSEGPVNPHDILRIKGPRAVQEYLLNEVQEVYRLQGVKINDKHIGVIVRQMLQKVRVIDPGETEFLEGEHVDKHAFRDENERAKKKKLQPATSEPLLLGDHQGESDDAVVRVGGLVPGDDARVDRRVDPRCAGRSLGPQGEHHHRAPDPGRHRDVPVSGGGDRGDGDPAGAARGGGSVRDGLVAVCAAAAAHGDSGRGGERIELNPSPPYPPLP